MQQVWFAIGGLLALWAGAEWLRTAFAKPRAPLWLMAVGGVLWVWVGLVYLAVSAGVLRVEEYAHLLYPITPAIYMTNALAARLLRHIRR